MDRRVGPLYVPKQESRIARWSAGLFRTRHGPIERIDGPTLWKPVAAAGVAFPVTLLVSASGGFAGFASLVLVALVAAAMHVAILIALGTEADDRAMLSTMGDAMKRLGQRPAQTCRTRREV